MKEFRIVWQACPHNHNPERVLFVQAETEEDARTIAKDHIERKFWITWFSIHNVSETAPLPPGKVTSDTKLG